MKSVPNFIDSLVLLRSYSWLESGEAHLLPKVKIEIHVEFYSLVYMLPVLKYILI